jgi:hypothetical protein
MEFGATASLSAVSLNSIETTIVAHISDSCNKQIHMQELWCKVNLRCNCEPFIAYGSYKKIAF